MSDRASGLQNNVAKMHELRVRAEDEIERLLLQHIESGGMALDRAELRHQMDLAIAATIVENKIKARGSSDPQ